MTTSIEADRLVFREANQQDSEAVERLYLELTEDSNVTVLPDRILAIDSDPNNFLFVVESESKVLASCFITFCLDPMYGKQTFAVLENIIVTKYAQGGGVGKFLMQNIESFCFQRDCTKLMFLSSARRNAAHQFFESMGYRGDIKRGFVKYRSDVSTSSKDRAYFFL